MTNDVQLTIRISFLLLLFGGVMLLGGCGTFKTRTSNNPESQSPPPLLNDNPTVPPAERVD